MTRLRAHRASTIWVVCACGLVVSGVATLQSVGRERIASAHAQLTRPAVRFERISSRNLPNAIRVHRTLISGGQPNGAAGFAKLVKLGVRTAISVDGTPPDVAKARAHGIQYVHLPLGYDGIPEQRVFELAKAVSELPGPIYIHCHHGKHRSPAAAAALSIAAGLISREGAVELLKMAGTNADYAGLFRSVTRARRINRATLASTQVEFRESVPPPPIVDVMNQLEVSLGRLKQLQSNGWLPQESLPGRTRSREALQLRELFAELARDPDQQHRDVAFERFLTESEALAEQLRTGLPSAADAAITQLRSRCTDCHRRFRDVFAP